MFVGLAAVVSFLNTGSTRKSYEAEPLAKQFMVKVGVFACQQPDVFRDAPGEVTDGWPHTVVSEVKGDPLPAKRKHGGTWVNTDMFVPVWKIIAAGERYQSTEWVVKVDIDAVFTSGRVQSKLSARMIPANGFYLVYCPLVEYEYFGNSVIFSVQAFDTLIARMVVCYSSSDINWKLGGYGGKHGPLCRLAWTCMVSRKPKPSTLLSIDFVLASAYCVSVVALKVLGEAGSDASDMDSVQQFSVKMCPSYRCVPGAARDAGGRQEPSQGGW